MILSGGGIGTVHTDDLDAHTRDWWEVLRTGEYYVIAHAYLANDQIAMTANQLHAHPLIIARTMTLDRIAIQVSTLAADKSARLGIYNDGTNLYPGTLLLDAGEVSVATTGVKAATINQQLTKGLYWVVMVTDGTPSIKRLRIYGHSVLGQTSTALAQSRLGWYVAFTYAALPDPFTAGGTMATGNLPVVSVRIASLD